jgi:hypothetical protein
VNSQLEPLERLLLWKMIFLGYEPAQSKTKPKTVSPVRTRRKLLDMGLIEIEKRGKSGHLVLTDKAWLWASENLEAEISIRSYESGPILQTVLAKLKVFLTMKELPLAEFLHGKIRNTPEPGTAAIHNVRQPLEERIRDAYQKISRGRWNTPVRLAEIRKALVDVPRDEQDKELRRLKLEDRILLLPMEDPQDRAPRG